LKTLLFFRFPKFTRINEQIGATRQIANASFKSA